MRCPACSQLLPEDAPACPDCAFDLAAAGHRFGTAPRLEVPFTDLTGSIGRWKKRALRDALMAFSRDFPQVTLSAVVVRLPEDASLAEHVFWLFNSADLHAAQESGGNCRAVLIELDLTQSRAACALGYGLEPFIAPMALERIAAAARDRLLRGDVAGAVLRAVDAARNEFAAVCRSLPLAFGLDPTAGFATGEAVPAC